MSTQPTEATETAPVIENTEATENQKPTETVEFWKEKAREQEKRAKANAEAAKRLAEIEESQKSDAQKSADRIAALEKQASDSAREALRFKVASKYGISDEDADLFLTGSDEDTLTKQATRLAARVDEQKKQGNKVPREGATPANTAGEGVGHEFVRALFAKD